MRQISLLLGAGFSVNKGYPTAKQLNGKLANLNPEQLFVESNGSLLMLDGVSPSRNSWDSYKYFTVDLIRYFSNHGDFDYEKFYDFYQDIYQGRKEDKVVNEIAKSFCDKFHEIDLHNLLLKNNIIFNQLISLFLVDSEGKKNYEPAHWCKPIYPGYTGFLNCLEEWGKTNVVHIHTLNHDLFLETFNTSDWLQGKLSDGFEEMGSPYFGDFQEKYKIRLSYFSENYNSNFRLYKLHGSTDQYPFHIENQGIDTYIKIKPGIKTTSLLKEVKSEKGEIVYISDWINYHADFLTGTTSKILRYREPFYYENIFKRFEENLTNSDILVLVGYGCGDSEINELIQKCYNLKNPIFILDPFPHENTTSFCTRFNAKLIKKDPERMVMQDFV